MDLAFKVHLSTNKVDIFVPYSIDLTVTSTFYMIYAQGLLMKDWQQAPLNYQCSDS